MSRFVLTAQLQLQAPTNVGQIVNQIQNQLNGVTVNVQVQNAAQATRQINQVTAATQQCNNAATQLGRSFGLSIKRFAAFSIATRAVSLFTSSLSNAVKEAIAFERELIKISQVTGKTISELRDLTDEITRLSTNLGVSSSSLLNVSRILSQAGLSAQETKIALDALAKSDLAPTFDDITQTAEGAVAIFNQFRQGAAALEEQLGAINAVAGKFAVEAGDLISVIRRTGGVFQAAGGDLNELIALFTSVRATTRESAESIATGLRTIFTRIQRPKTIEFLRQYGVELLDLEGKFVGPFEATRRLSEALAGLEQGDITFIKIAEELGGFRQIGKVIPLLGQFAVAQEALNVAQKGSGSLAEDAATAQASLAVRITKVKEEFLALVRSISESTSFQLFANTALNLASALIKLADALKPVLPLLATLAGIRLATGFGGFLRGIGSGLRTPRGFATGGLVPGSGNRDTVPAMLTPGEFVIRKSSVAKLGAQNLAAMNENRFAKGSRIKPEMRNAVVSPGARRGTVGGRDIANIPTKQPIFASKQSIGIATTSYLPNAVKGNISFSRDEMLNQYIGGKGQSLMGMFGNKSVSYFNKIFPSGKGKGFSYPTVVEGVGKDEEVKFKNIIDTNITQAISGGARDFASQVMGTSLTKPIKILPSFYEKLDQGFRGQFFENIITALNGRPLKGSDSQRPFDFTRGIGGFKKIYSNLGMNYVDSRITATSAGVGAGAETQASQALFLKKAEAQLALELLPQMMLLKKQEQALAKKSQGIQGSSRAIPSQFTRGQYYKGSEIRAAMNLSSNANLTRYGFTQGTGGNSRSFKFATGGAVGTDTVPALLTPGEFVVNRSSAQKIGYGNLNRMNKVGKYANGGVVQRFANGGSANSTGGGSAMMALTLLPAAIQSLLPPIDETSSGLAKATNNLLSFSTTIASVGFALQAFGVSLNASNIKNLFGKGSGGIGSKLTGFERQGSAIPFFGKTTRRTGTGFGEAFNLAGERDRRARILRSARASVGDDLTLKGNIRSQNLSTRLARPGALTGRLGAGLARTPVLGSVAKAVGGSSTFQFIGKLFGPLTKILGPLTAGFSAMLGPILAIVGVAAAINGIVSGFRDLDGKLQDAIKAEDTARAQQLAVSKAASESIPIIGDIVGAIGDAFGPGTSEAIVGFFSLFGGPSVASIKANIDAQIKSAKAQKSLKETAEKAAEAMKEFEAGNISAAEAAKAAAASSQAIFESRLAAEKANKENTALKSTGGYAVARNIFTLGGLFGETSGARNRRIDQENQKRTDEQKKLEDEQFKVAQPAINAFGRQLAATGGNFDQFKEQLLAMGFSADFVRRKENDLRKSFENIAKEAERTRKAFDAMNLGFRNIQSVSGALSVSMNNYLASQEAGYNQLENVISTLEASVTSAAAGISDEDFGSALGFAAAGLRDLGASNQQINKFTENLTAINKAQQIFAQASEEAKQALIDEFKRGVTGQTGAGPTREKFAEVIANQLEQAGIGEATRERIKDALANADISQDDLNAILAGDISVLDKVLNDLGETTLKQVIGPLQELAKYQSQLVNITKKRLELEDNLIQAQRNLLSAQLEAQEIIAKYGGPAVTPEIRRQNILDQANLQASRTGVGALRAGSAAELNARSAQARARLAEIGSLRAEAARQGPQGDAARQRLSGEEGAKLAAEEKRLQELAKSDYETTKQLIQLKEEELKLIQEKNRLEKSSIEALITGDIAKFFEQQAAVGATAAIALGNDSLQNAFGPQALGQAALDIQKQQQAGVQSLYGQQLGGAGGLVERGFGAAISARGVGGAGALSMAQMAAGTTAEEEAARAEIRSLAATLPNYAETQLQVAQQDKTTADIQYQAAQMQLQAAKETARARGVDIAGMAKGGVVYANRGIFVPKGTDTVPAMLTPGEFVVRREAVRRGNNLQLLQSMNRGQSGVSTNGAVAMADGGVVYARRGIFVNRNSGVQQTNQTGIGLSPDLVNKLATSLNNFNSTLSANIDRLNNTSFNVKLDTTNVNVNLNGGSFLSKLKDDLKNELLVEIGNQIKNYSIGQDGRLKSNPGTLT